MSYAFSEGLLNALRKMDSARKCSGCSFSIPPYPGRYPSSCPVCNCDIEHMEESSFLDDILDAITEGQLTSDEVIRCMEEGSIPFPCTYAYDREEDVNTKTFQSKKRPLNSFKEKLLFPRGTVIGAS